MNERAALADEIVVAAEHERLDPDDPGRATAAWLASTLGLPERVVHVDPSVDDVVDAIVGRLRPHSLLVMHSEHANRWSGKRSVTEHVVDQWAGLACIEGPARAELRSGPVLVALDGSRETLGSLDAARRLAEAFGSSVVLARVSPDPFDDRDGAARDLARRGLEAVAEPGEEIAVLQSNLVVEALCREAADRGCSLIVLASRGDRSTPRATMSRTCSGLVASATQPVVIVGGTSSP
jgi:nucleotide-binding universal stress UspA family protein